LLEPRRCALNDEAHPACPDVEHPFALPDPKRHRPNSSSDVRRRLLSHPPPPRRAELRFNFHQGHPQKKGASSTVPVVALPDRPSPGAGPKALVWVGWVEGSEWVFWRGKGPVGQAVEYLWPLDGQDLPKDLLGLPGLKMSLAFLDGVSDDELHAQLHPAMEQALKALKAQPQKALKAQPQKAPKAQAPKAVQVPPKAAQDPPRAAQAPMQAAPLGEPPSLPVVDPLSSSALEDDPLPVFGFEDLEVDLRSFLSSFTTSGSFEQEHHHGDCRCCNVQDSFGNTWGFL
jgi:hypothetical protein